MGRGAVCRSGSPSYHHNLAVYGWTVRQAYADTIGQATAAVTGQQGVVSSFSPMVSHGSERAMLRALDGPSTGPDSTVTMVDAARAVAADGGIDTLVVVLGANNALPARSSCGSPGPAWITSPLCGHRAISRPACTASAMRSPISTPAASSGRRCRT